MENPLASYWLYRSQRVGLEKRLLKESRRHRSMPDADRRQETVRIGLRMDQIIRDIILMERIHEREGSRVYFIEDPQLLEFLEQSNFEVDPTELVFPARVISVALPRVAPNTAGFLLGRQEPSLYKNDIIEVNVYANVEPPTIITDSAEPLITLSMISPKEPAARLHCGVPFNQVGTSLSGIWLREHMLQTSTTMSDYDTEVQSRHLNLGLRLLAYMAAFPDTVKQGMPDASMESGHRPDPRFKPFTIGLHPKIKHSPSAHFRRGHFRSLRHERFHRDELGNIRIIYVNPMIVGDVIDPYTVENL